MAKIHGWLGSALYAGDFRNYIVDDFGDAVELNEQACEVLQNAARAVNTH